MLVIVVVLFCFLNQSVGGSAPVLLGFYGESLCPDCINFSNGPLTKAFDEVRW